MDAAEGKLAGTEDIFNVSDIYFKIVLENLRCPDTVRENGQITGKITLT